MIELKNLSKVYSNYNDNYITALRGVNLKLAKTGLTFIVGPSGSGKSTLINILSGIDVPTGGEMLVNGVNTAQFNSSGVDGYRNNYVGIIYQDYNLLDHLTLGQNVALQLEVQGKTADPKVVSQLFEKLGIGGMEDRYPTQCSGGQCQRAAIARVLIKQPKILFADEPTAAVDQEQRIGIYELLRELSKEILIVTSTHSREMVDRFADRVVTIQNGQIVSDVVTGDDKSTSEVFGETVMAVEPGVTLNYEDIDRLNKMIDSHNKKGTKGVYLCIETDAEKVEKIHPVAAKQLQAALKNKQKQKMAQKETRIKMIHEEPTGVFQFEATRLPLKSAWGMSLINLRGNKLRSFFTILLSILAVTFFALSANMSKLDANSAVKYSFSASNANYLTVNSKNEIYTTEMKDEWTAVPNSVNVYNKTSLVYDFGPSATMAPTFGGLIPAETEIYSVSKLAVVNPGISTTNEFGHSLKADPNGNGVMGRWPTAANEIVISDFIATQVKTAAFAKSRNIASVPTYAAFYEENNDSGWSIFSISNHNIRYKVVGIYETGFEHYFEFDQALLPEEKVFAVGTKDYFNTWEMLRLKSGLTAQESKQAEYLLQHDFVTGYVSQSLINGIMDGTSIGSAGGLFYASTSSNVTVGNSFRSVGANNYFMTMHPNGYEMDVPSSNAPGLYSNIFGAAAYKGLVLKKGAWGGNVNSIKVSRGFYKDILGGNVSGVSVTDSTANAKKTFSPSFAKRNVTYTAMSNNQTLGMPSEEIVMVPIPQSYDVLWKNTFTVENIGVDAFADPLLNTDEYVIQFSGSGNETYKKFVELLVIPSSSFIISNQYNQNVMNSILGKVSNTFDGNIAVSYSDAAAIEEFVTTISDTAGFMLIASIVFGMFAVCLMYSYIYSSVRSKRKSIGIIRSLGARTRDVMRIFVFEALLVSVLILLGSFTAIALSALIANVMVQKTAAYSIVLFNLSFKFFLTIFLATLAVIFACYIIPAIAFARHKKNRGLIKDIQVLSEN